MIFPQNHLQLSNGNKSIVMKNTLFFIFLLSASCIYSQTKSDTVFRIQKGKKYLVHIAVNGNTLWGIHALYKVEVNDLVSANPGIDKSVKEGNVYLIPAGKTDLKVPDGTEVIWHSVIKGETVYKISKQYGTTEAELKKLNPTIGAGLTIGQKIWIQKKTMNAVVEMDETTNVSPVNSQSNSISSKQPTVVPVKPVITFSDSVISYMVKPKENMYSISKRFMVPVAELQSFNGLKSSKIKEGEIIKIPLKKENFSKIEVRAVEPLLQGNQKSPIKSVEGDFVFKTKSEYKIAILLPFKLNETSNTQLKTIATEFYMGAKLAIDSLGRQGLKANYDIIDFPQDSAGIVSFLRKNEMKNYDLLFGPLLSDNAKIVAQWCKENRIRMVCPAQVNPDIFENNPFVFGSVSSESITMQALARYTVKNLGKSQIILVNSGDSKNQELYTLYRSYFMDLAAKNGNVKLIEAKISDYASFILKNKNNTLIFPYQDKNLAVKFASGLSKVNNRIGAGTITLLGTKDWLSFDEISASMRNEYHITWAANNDINYKAENMKNFLRAYRAAYKADANKYAVQGYDVIMYFSKFLLLEEKPSYLVSNVFSLGQKSKDDGFENNGVIIIENNNFELKQVQKFENE
jgi:LysM repeat protein/ABC-type branched-subunit amino acid transport system substrate-binding protein